MDGISVRRGVDMVISAWYKKRALELIMPTFDIISEWFSTAMDDCRELCNIILSLFDDFIKGDITSEVTYRRVFFLGSLLVQMEAIKMTTPNDVLHGALQKMLKQVNLNTEVYSNYCINRFAGIIAQIPDISDKLVELNNMKRRLLYAEVVSGSIYQQPLPDLKYQLQDWLRRQIAVVTAQRSASANDQPSRKDLIDEKFKIAALMGMDVLAVLFWAAREAGLIAISGYSSFFRFVAKYFSVRNIATFKDTSFKSRFSEPYTPKALLAALRFIRKMEEKVKEKLNIIEE